MSYTIKRITVKQANAIISSRQPLGLFYVLKNGYYIGIDNSNAHAWTEDFPNLLMCERWLYNPNMEREEIL
jgi:chromosome condensin MukBEF MukE localization factor